MEIILYKSPLASISNFVFFILHNILSRTLIRSIERLTGICAGCPCLCARYAMITWRPVRPAPTLCGCRGLWSRDIWPEGTR